MGCERRSVCKSRTLAICELSFPTIRYREPFVMAIWTIRRERDRVDLRVLTDEVEPVAGGVGENVHNFAGYVYQCALLIRITC